MSVAGALTVRDALAAAAAELERAGCETPRLDAELLLGEALGATRAALVARSREPLGIDVEGRFEALLARRAAREPVALILGRRGFRHLELTVTRDVLVPRPETETLVEAALELPRGARVVDVGTGGGAVALALKHERPDLEVVATDISDAALDVARADAQRLGLDVRFARGDLLDGVTGPWDAVVSNPPYVAERERGSLPPELAYEPPGALFAGADGLEVIGRLVAAAPAPWLACEVGAGQAAAVRRLMRAAGYERIGTRRDLAGAERVVVGCGR